MENWIKIEDAQPEDGDIVFTYFEFTRVEIAKYSKLKDYKSGGHMFSNKSGFLTDDVTHWMPVSLPKPPEGGN